MHISFCIYAVPHTFAKDAPPKTPQKFELLQLLVSSSYKKREKCAVAKTAAGSSREISD